MQFQIEVYQEVVLPRVIEGVEVIGIILKEGTFAVSGLQSTPMVMLPVAVVTETYILDGRVRGSGTNGNHQVL